MLADCTALRAALPRLASAIRFGLLLLTRCRSAHLVEVQPNFRLLRQSPQCGERSNAAFGTQSAAKQTSLAPHDSKARLRVVANRRRFMAKPCTPHPIPQAAQLFELQTANVRGQGGSPLAFLWGFQRGCSLWKENTPFDRQQRLRAAFPLRAVRGKNHLACKATILYTPWCKTI